MQLVKRSTGLALTESNRTLAQLSQPTIAQLLHLSAADFRTTLETALGSAQHVPGDATQGGPRSAAAPRGTEESALAPIDGETEVWAAGVTYRRSEEARVEESAAPDIYTRVYTAQRPELFFKANARRVAGPNQPIAVRADSTWDVPEPELALVVNARAEILGYTICNDVSSRSIEGDNPLYLPQAKVYARSCALGPGITPAWQVEDPYVLELHMRILRGGAVHWQGQASTSELKRRLDELVSYLFREDDFPDGVILSTGTALVPESPFTLQAGDLVEIEIPPLGQLRNPVVSGKAAR